MRRRATRLIVLLLATAVAVWSAVVFPAPAYACSCAGISTARALREADAVFQGSVVTKEVVGRGADARQDVRFLVTRVYKGTVYADQLVASRPHSAECGLDPAPGSVWTVFAIEGVEGSGDDLVQRLVTGLCQGNLPGTRTPALLGAGEPPRPGSSDREERSVRTDKTLTRGLVTGGVVLLVVVGLGLAGLAALWRPGRRREGS